MSADSRPDPPEERPSAPVSVVVPCYRCMTTIDRAIASIESQTVRPAEIILVDDASGDGTLDALLEVQKVLGANLVKVIALERNVGAGEARNAGWNVATHPFIAFLDADDAWHPRKIEVQYAFMRDHPEVGVSGHAHGIVRTEMADPPPPAAGYHRISRRELLLSNRFITPSAMVRRDLPIRFRQGKRRMEDHALWLDLVVAGVPVAYLNACLAYIFKAPLGEAGLSARILAMEAGELAMYRDLWREKKIGFASFFALTLYSGGKFFRRLLVRTFRPREKRFSWFFPVGYLSVTHATPALLVLIGLAGRSELAAEIAVISGATIATFHAFSANTRGLILARSAAVSVRDVLALRVLLVLPLGLLSFFMSTVIADVGAGLAIVLVLRRAVEWFNEVHLCDAELRENRGFVLGFNALQASLFAGTAVFLARESPYAIFAACIWALAPLAVSLPFIFRALRGLGHNLIRLLPELLPHLGSTAMIGLSIYASRLLILMFVEKSTAGDLFVAIAIGSFLGTIFGNVLGPSFLLDQNRTGITSLPLSMRLALTFSLATGFCLAALAVPLSLSNLGLGKTSFFWLAAGLSLVGGVLMVAAQRVRLRILTYDDGRELFGPDVLTHVLVMAAIPFAFGLWGPGALAGFYLYNALLAFVLYKTAEIAHSREVASSDQVSTDRLRSLIAFVIFLPVFFQLSGTIYNVSTPVIDSEGVLSSLPLPFSIIACFLGIVLLGGYRRAALGYAFVFALFAFLLSSILVTPASVVIEEKRKFLLLMQCLLPAFGIVLGMQFEDFATRPAIVEKSIGAILIILVPAQLLSTWLKGELALSHDVWAFSVYQHWQYVPVVICAAYLVALSRLWTDPRFGRVLKVGAPLLAIYALASVSTLSVALLMLGLALLTARLVVRTRRCRHAIPMLLAALAGIAYGLPFRDDSLFAFKYPQFASGKLEVRAPCSSLRLARVSGAVSANGPTCEIHVSKAASWDWLVISQPYGGPPNQALVVEGVLHQGGLRIGLLKFGVWHIYQDLLIPGAFKVVVPAPEELAKGRGFAAALAYYNPSTQGEVAASITRFAREPRVVSENQTAAAKDPGNQAKAPERNLENPGAKEPDPSALPPNFLERLEDWRLFGKPILDSPKTFFFGHAMPIDRSVRTSAHNYYLDTAYLFGVTALLPVFWLIVVTLGMVVREHRRVFADSSLLLLIAVVLFLVLVDSNFKVTLRQPYPGIATFFLWGLLLARLRGDARIVSLRS